MKNQNSLIFIPDISGFTEFVNETEVQHSQHIISELLEAIIDANELDLTVAEIEGDAILFYKKEVPSTEAIVDQAAKMFKAFHEHLGAYSNRRICECGACTTASDLSLKFIAHSGPMNIIKVKDFEKPHGAPVILAHRLLKNDVSSNEYLLLSDALIEENDGLKSPQHTWVNWQNQSSDYNDVGTVNYQYTELTPLHEEIKEEQTIAPAFKLANPISREIYIDRPPKEIFSTVINFDVRLDWTKGLNDLKYEKDKINQIGTIHQCVIGNRNVELQTVTGEFGEGDLVYGEDLMSPPPIFKHFVNYFVLQKQDKGTLLRFEAHIQPKGIFGKLLLPFLKRKLMANLGTNLMALKNLCESKKAMV